MTELDVGRGLEFIDLEVSALLHIDISIYSLLSEIPSSLSSLFPPSKRVINEQKRGLHKGGEQGQIFLDENRNCRSSGNLRKISIFDVKITNFFFLI